MTRATSTCRTGHPRTHNVRRARVIMTPRHPRGRAARLRPRRAPASPLPTLRAERSSRCRIPPARGRARSATLPSTDDGTGCARRRPRSPAHRRTRSECAAQKAGRTVPPTSLTGARQPRGRGGSPARCEGHRIERPRRFPVRIRRRERPAPCAGDGRAPHGLRGCACERGTRGSCSVCECSAGRSASSVVASSGARASIAGRVRGKRSPRRGPRLGERTKAGAIIREP